MDERITEYDGDRACYLMSLEGSFGSKQRQLILNELRGMDDESNEYAQLAYSFLNSISSPYGNGIIFVFDERILYLRDEVIERMLDDLNEYFFNTDFMYSFNWIHSVQNDLDGAIEIHPDNLIQSYLDACAKCEYTVSKAELYDIFEERFSKDDIDKVILSNLLRNPELFSN